MAFELAAYGALASVFRKMLPKKASFIHISLILTMLGGRVVLLLVSLPFYAAVSGVSFSFGSFFTFAFVGAIPGIILQIAVIPYVVLLLEENKLI